MASGGKQFHARNPSSFERAPNGDRVVWQVCSISGFMTDKT
ncbi:hypothetical protein O23A_p1234 [Aeromonas salmonicida]|nr:hypothetical protein O23A_p1234 [Aeromonas salmonicida]